MRLFCGTASFFCGWGKGDKWYRWYRNYRCYNTYSTYNTYFNFEGERNAANTFLGNFLKLEIDKRLNIARLDLHHTPRHNNEHCHLPPE